MHPLPPTQQHSGSNGAPEKRNPWDSKLACYDWHHKGMGGHYSEKTGVRYSSWQPSYITIEFTNPVDRTDSPR